MIVKGSGARAISGSGSRTGRLPDLAYSIAVGHVRFRMAARAAAESLLGPGGFRGDVVIFTDRPARWPAGVREVVVSDPILLAQPKRLKFRIGDFIDLLQ